MNIPILTYHALTTVDTGYSYATEKREFVRHLEFLINHDFHSVAADNLYISVLGSREKLPRKTVVITFDDGHESDATIARPSLADFGLIGNFFVTSDWIGRAGYMSSRQIRSLAESGMRVQSHARSHSFLDSLSPGKVRYELNDSKKRLEDILGLEVPFLSLPGGRYNKRVIRIAKEVGYSAIFASTPFWITYVEGVPIIGRCMVKCSRGGTNFYSCVSKNKIYRTRAQLVHFFKWFLRKCISTKLYYFLWQKVNRLQ